jgi:hypothetical protein
VTAIAPRRNRPAPLVIAAVVPFLAAILVYLPALWTGFTADDFFILSRLKQFGGLSDPLAYFTGLGFFEYYRPVAFLSHAIDWQFWGLNPAGYHLTNLLLHASSSSLVFGLGRRLGGVLTGVVAGLIFAVHPASHEAVYWISARFDVLATFLTLLALLLLTGSPRAYVAGVVVFALALLAKESALALPAIFLAHDVLIRKLRPVPAVTRLIPIGLVAIGYALLRSSAGALAAAGGTSRLPKLAMLAVMMAVLLWLAGSPRDANRPRAGATKWFPLIAILLVLAGAATVILVLIPATSLWVREKIGFASFALFYLLSPVTFPPPSSAFFDRPEAMVAVAEAAAVVVVVLGVWRSRHWLTARPAALFALVFAAGALAPVSSMTSGPRYLYLAFAGVSLLAGLVVRHATPGVRARWLTPVLTVLLVASSVQLLAAARAWKWSSDMTRASLALISSTLTPCGTQDVVVLTTPVGMRGVFSNLNEVAFEVAGCKPASYATLLRAMYREVHVEAVRRGDTIELRVPGYAGTFVTAADLRHFDIPIATGDLVAIDTPIGRLTTTVENGTQVFRLSLVESARRAAFFFYSDGRLHSL